jgi:hypothetical protein
LDRRAPPVPEAHHVALCKLHHLAKFLGEAKGRREHYFTIVAEGPATLEAVLHREPSEQDVLSWIAFVLGKDRTFIAYVSDHGGAAQALEPEKWRRVLEAGAGMIVGTYLIARENGHIT